MTGTLLVYPNACPRGRGRIAGEPFAPGQVWLIPAGAELFRLEPRGPARLLTTYVPQ
jgi:hypothetical protein